MRRADPDAVPAADAFGGIDIEGHKGRADPSGAFLPARMGFEFLGEGLEQRGHRTARRFSQRAVCGDAHGIRDLFGQIQRLGFEPSGTQILGNRAELEQAFAAEGAAAAAFLPQDLHLFLCPVNQAVCLGQDAQHAAHAAEVLQRHAFDFRRGIEPVIRHDGFEGRLQQLRHPGLGRQFFQIAVLHGSQNPRRLSAERCGQGGGLVQRDQQVVPVIELDEIGFLFDAERQPGFIGGFQKRVLCPFRKGDDHGALCAGQDREGFEAGDNAGGVEMQKLFLPPLGIGVPDGRGDKAADRLPVAETRSQFLPAEL